MMQVWLLARIALLIFLLALIFSSARAFDLTLPDSDLTPGVVRKLSLKTICSTRWGTDRRFVTAAMKREVYKRYGLSGPHDKACVPDRAGRRCEIDHRLPRSLAGADHIKNLWPEPFGTHPFNAARKDRLEVLAHKKVCNGELSLKKAQAIFLTGDWTVAYRKYIGKP